MVSPPESKKAEGLLDTLHLSGGFHIVPGRLFAGRYEVEKLLGRGGMGAVYKVVDKKVGDTVALKILILPDDKTSTVVERFRREVRLARKVTHPNVARTHDLNDQEGVHYLTMEYVEGRSLQSIVESEKRLSPRRAAEIARGICEGLAAAHDAGVIHRDLKPANVLVEASGRVVITDFGIARATVDQSGAMTQGPLGTPLYMAPEQVTGGSIDQRTDVYALGLIMYEMLTGTPPFIEDNAIATALARLRREPADPRSLADVPDALAELVLACLRVPPQERVQSAREVSQALAGFIAQADTESGVIPRQGPAGSLRPAADAAPTPTKRLASSPGKQTRGTSSASQPFAPISPGGRAIAVLPFKYRGPSDSDYLGDGLAEELIDVLSTTRGLRVLASGATARYRDERDPNVVGSALGVDAIIDGTVQRSGDRVRIAARLIEVSTGVQLWSDRFDGEVEDVLALQERMSKRIAEALRIEMTAAAYRDDVPKEAVELYLQAKRRLRGGAGPAAIDGALLLDQCLELAPDFKPAIAARAIAGLRAWFLPLKPNVSERDWATEAREGVARAEAEAPELAETHLARAMLATTTADYKTTARSLAKALEIAPTFAEAHHYLGALQIEAGRASEGVKREMLVRELDPTMTIPLVEMGRWHALNGRFDEAKKLIDECFAREGPDYMPALALQQRVAAWYRNDDMLRDSVRRIDANSNPVSRLLAIYGQYLLGQVSKDAFLGPLQALLGPKTHPRFACVLHQNAAEVAALTGDVDLALHYVNLAADGVLVDLDWVDKCAALDPVRQRSEFAEARRRVRARAEAIWTV